MIRENLGSLHVTEGYEIVQNDALKALRQLQMKDVAADFIFLDPPYRMKQAYRDTLEYLEQSSVAKQTAVVVAEHQQRADPGEELGGLKRYRKLMQGDAALSFYRRS